MTIKILDYKRKESEVDIGELNNIAKITLSVVTGDEIISILYKDYSEKIFNSSYSRTMDFYDGEYEIFDFRKSREENLIFDENWLNRYCSYTYL